MSSNVPNDGQPSELNDGEVHVWYSLTTDPVSPQRAERYFRLLDEEEVHRHEKFLSEKARIEHLITRAFVRTTLGRYLKSPPESLRFRRNEFGRPELAGAEAADSLRFNVSHSDGLVACAVVRRREIGVDVECARRVASDEDVARRHFAAAEFEDYLRQPTAEKKHARFLEYWTLKEAYLKARGVGLLLPLDKFSCQWERPDQVHLTLDPVLHDDASTWQLCQLKAVPDFVAALAVRKGQAEPLRIIEVLAKPE